MRNKIIGALLVVCLLIGSWFWANDNSGSKTPDNNVGISQQTKEELWSDDIYETSQQNEEAAEAQKVAEEDSLQLEAAQSTAEGDAATEIASVNDGEIESQNVIQTSEDAGEQMIDETVKKNVCILSVRCDAVLLNKDKLSAEKMELIPQDGVIFAETEVEMTPGESVFDLLVREMRKNKIHLEFNETPMYKSAYIEGINNLYQFDCGELSGWIYRVNGQVQRGGCSQCFLQPGDRVEWIFTCNLGRDL